MMGVMPQNTPATFTEYARIMRDMVRKGTVAAVAGNRVRVQTGELLTNWLPWMCPRAGQVKISSIPSIGEQCLIVSENGDLNAGTVMPALHSTANPLPDDCGQNDLILEVPAGGRLVLRCGSSSVVITENSIKALAGRIDLN